jgi:deoxyhypusine synthase
VSAADFATPYLPGTGLAGFIESLPDILAGRDFKDFIGLMRTARSKRKPILLGLGAHVIKVGLNPVLIGLMKDGWVNGLALNGAGIIHDFEIAFGGRTSEDVAVQIKAGKFGMAREPAEMLNGAIRNGARRQKGLGEAVGKMMASSGLPYRNLSLLASAYEMDIPVTVHVAIGTDTIHFHPQASGQALGQTSLADFHRFCSLLEKLEGGGVYINIGSAVILPEVFLKAVSCVRNQGRRLQSFTTAVFDFYHHYRPEQNIVRRAVGKKGRGFYFIGHHEILVPLLAAALGTGR